MDVRFPAKEPAAESYSIENDQLMSPTQKRFYASETCNEARAQLQALVDNPKYNTDSDYYQTSSLDFVERHLYHLSTHPNTNLLGYISNLKLMTASKPRG